MPEFYYRTEDMRLEEVAEYFVETTRDREIINQLKSRIPVILAGSRGVGKSFLLRVAESELSQFFEQDRVLPVYVSFNRSSLILTSDPQQFQHWMLARICSRLVRSLRTRGLVVADTPSVSILAGGTSAADLMGPSPIDLLVDHFENSWKSPPAEVDLTALPSLDDFRDAIEDTCVALGLSRIVVLIDEAAHILIPEQQRQFFTLFRDLRTPYIACKATVYPGVTAYGDTFQPTHDATMLTLERDVLDPKYVDWMQEIAEKQAESDMQSAMLRNRGNFALLAFAASGNPRIMLKTLTRAPRLNSTQTDEVVREYYRSDLWSEHSTLPDKYPGHKQVIEWGRNFIESVVLPDLQAKNAQYLAQEQKSTCFFWVHRDAPQAVKEALRLLAYTGIVYEHAVGIRATRSEIGTRYGVNLGALIALEAYPTRTGLGIARNLTVKRMAEFGANHAAYQPLLEMAPAYDEATLGGVLEQQLRKPIDVLDITPWQKAKLHEIRLDTIGDLLRASETLLQTLSYVGEKRSRRMKNAAIAAVFEYLSG